MFLKVRIKKKKMHVFVVGDTLNIPLLSLPQPYPRVVNMFGHLNHTYQCTQLSYTSFNYHSTQALVYLL